MMLTYEEQLDRNLEWALREGSMHFEGESAVHKTLHRICQRLDELGIDYAIVGGMAMYMHGFRRFTEDVDILVTREGLQRIHEEIEGRGFIRPFEKSKNLRDAETRVRVEFLITGQFPGDGRAGPVAFPDPARVVEVRGGLKVLNLDNLMALKLASSRGAGRRKDLADAQELIRTLKLPLEFRDRLDPSLRELYAELWQELERARLEGDPQDQQ
ncbi:MAG TPA: hypothetical protein VEQ85_12775 [Lacipirellulaceae bacterium]|nr:hypothetical protein [Lacipirellulaceae bacterium]